MIRHSKRAFIRGMAATGLAAAVLPNLSRAAHACGANARNGDRVSFKSLMADADIRSLAAADFDLPTLPKDGKWLLGEAAKRFTSDNTAYFRCGRYDADVELTSYPHASSSWYSDRRIQFLIWPGDLTIDGDLIDDAFDTPPFLVICGNLTVRSWLRGGLPSFIGGSVRASGFIVGHYNDSALFVGGDLTATGYITRARPYPDFPHIVPHQIAGKLDARKFVSLDASDKQLRKTFVDEVLTKDEEAIYLNEKAVLSRSKAGEAVWR